MESSPLHEEREDNKEPQGGCSGTQKEENIFHHIVRVYQGFPLHLSQQKKSEQNKERETGMEDENLFQSIWETTGY